MTITAIVLIVLSCTQPGYVIIVSAVPAIYKNIDAFVKRSIDALSYLAELSASLMLYLLFYTMIL